MKKYDKAKQTLLKAVELGVTSAYYNLGSLYYQLEDYDNAKKYIKKSAETGNDEARRLYNDLIRLGY